MERNMDAMGRIVIPSEFRKQLRVSDGDTLDLEVDNDRIIIKKVNSRPSDIRRETFFVYNKENIEDIKKKYPKGTIVECIEMVDDTNLVPTGTRGVVDSIDDHGSIHVNWENGKRYALIDSKDRFKTVR